MPIFNPIAWLLSRVLGYDGHGLRRSRNSRNRLFGPEPLESRRVLTATLGTAALIEGPTAGSDSDVLTESVATATWTAASNDSWLSVSPGSAGGTGSAVVDFSFTANTATTPRVGTLTIAGQTLTVTQAPASYVPVSEATTVVSTAFHIAGEAVDSSGNVYIADKIDNAIKEWSPATNTLTTLVSSGLSTPGGVAVDGAGNVYIADTEDNAIKEWSPVTKTLTTLLSAGLTDPEGVAVNGSGNVYIADEVFDEATSTYVGTIQEWSPATKMLTTLFSVGAFDVPGGVAVDSSGNVYIADEDDNTIGEWSPTTNTLTTLVSAGLNDPSGVVVDDAGNVYIADEYDNAIKEWSPATNTLTTLVSSGLSEPDSVAVDDAGNVYIADGGNNAIKEWSPSTSALTTLVSTFVPGSLATDSSGNVYIAATDEIEEWSPATNTLATLVSAGLIDALDLAVDSSGNVYIADEGDNTIKEWSPTTYTLTTLVSAGLNDLDAIVVDGSGNVYIAAGQNGVQEWSPAKNMLTTLVSSGLVDASGIAVDGVGNVYIADVTDDTIKEWSPSTSALTTLVSAGLIELDAIAVDGLGNVYIADQNGIQEWSQATNMLTTPDSSGFTYVDCLAVDGSGNVYINDGTLEELPRAFYNLTTTMLGSNAGSGELGVISASADLGAPFAPSSNQPWFTVSPIVSGELSFSYTANTTNIARAAEITVLGQQIDVTQFGTPALGATALVEGASAGSDSMVLGDAIPTAAWTAVSSAGWLSIAPGSASGAGNATIDFTFSANNSGAPRVGTLTIDGQPLTVTQAPASYTPAGVATLVSSPLSSPTDVAVDSSGNVYIADADAIKEWSPSTGTLTTLVSAGLSNPQAVAVDSSGNVYIADDIFNGSDEITGGAVKEWSRSTQLLTTLVSAGLDYVDGVAVDGSGNLYITDGDSLQKWSRSTQMLTTLVSSGFSFPEGVAVDGSGNVYFADRIYDEITTGDDLGAIQEWSPATNALTTLVSSGLNAPEGVAVDGAGKVYIADTEDGAIKEWSPTTKTLTTLVSAGVGDADGVAVDGSGNVYIADDGGNAIREWSPATNMLSTLISSALHDPNSVALDGSGNVYIADGSDGAIKEWSPTTNTLTTLVSGLSDPRSVAVDSSGDVYIADYAIQEWSPATKALTTLAVPGGLGTAPIALAVDNSGNLYMVSTDLESDFYEEWSPATQTLTTLDEMASGCWGQNYSAGIAVDGAGNVYFADPVQAIVNDEGYDSGLGGEDTLEEWSPATQAVNTLVSLASGSALEGITVDGSGNVYFTDDDMLQEWSPATQNVTTLASAGLDFPPGFGGNSGGLAADAAGNVYIADENGIEELPRAFVGPAPAAFSPNAGAGVLGFVSASGILAAPFAPVSDQPWLTIGTVSDDEIDYSFSANPTGASRTADVTVLGQQITITQQGNPAALGTAALIEGPAAGSDSDILTESVATATWTAASNDSWLSVSPGSGSGTGSATIDFTFTANTAATPRVGTITIAGQTLTVTQAPASYVSANETATLASAGLSDPSGIALDSSGNVYFEDEADETLKEWSPSTQTLTTLVSSPDFFGSAALAVDSSGNVYLGMTGVIGDVLEWSPATNTLQTLATDISDLGGIAVDGSGNLYIGDGFDEAIKEWSPSTRTLTTLIPSGVGGAYGISLDASGNLYIATGVDIEEWSPLTQTLTTLISSGLDLPSSVAVDASGNVYIGNDSVHFIVAGATSSIQEWSPSTQTLRTLVSSGLSEPYSIAADGSGNVYIDNTNDNAIQELPRAFFGPATTPVTSAAGSGALGILPAGEILAGSLAPTSNQPWLTVGAVSGGDINFSYTANTTGASRTADVTVLGQQLAITQQAAPGPTSSVNPLPARISLTSINVSWSGTAGSSGPITKYDISVSIDGGAFSPWLVGTSLTSSTYVEPLGLGHTYGFISRAHDSAGDVEATHATADTTVTTTMTPWQNPSNSVDVLGTGGTIVPADALQIIDYLNNNPVGTVLPTTAPAGSDYLDVAGTGMVDPPDALAVINFLNTVPLILTTTTLTSSSSTSLSGQPVTLTANLSANIVSDGPPTGMVTFFDGATLLGTGTLNGGVATLTLSTLTVGTHSIQAVYGGAASETTNFNSSQSSLLTQTVNAVGPTYVDPAANLEPVLPASVASVSPANAESASPGNVAFLSPANAAFSLPDQTPSSSPLISPAVIASGQASVPAGNGAPATSSPSTVAAATPAEPSQFIVKSAAASAGQFAPSRPLAGAIDLLLSDPSWDWLDD